ncbi:MAG: DUF4010 domain-containing protein [Candidatus Magasanikbacteria bacterium]
MFATLPFQLLLSVILGAVIGLERENGGQGDRPGSVGGIRTFSLICLLGGLAGFFYAQHISTMFLVLSILLSSLVVAYYVLGSLISKRTGLTNEISVVFAFLIGFFITSELMALQLVVALLIVVLLILSIKTHTRQVVVGISQQELQSFISYAIITLVILPFLPNKPFLLTDIPYLSTLLNSYDLSLGTFATLEIFNPRKLWLIIALVTGIDVFGYVLGKVVGNKKSFTLTSFVAGFISSTSTTQSLAQKSKKSPMVNSLIGAALLANLASFFQIFLLVGPLNGQLLAVITPTLLLIIITTGILSAFYLSKKENQTNGSASRDKKEGDRKIFALKPAIKFACILISVKLVTKVCLVLFGNSGFMISSVIASFAGIDAIVINLADMAGKVITFKTALITFILVNATNLLSKFGFSFMQGSRKFSIKFLVSVLIIIAVSFVGLFFVR